MKQALPAWIYSAWNHFWLQNLWLTIRFKARLASKEKLVMDILNKIMNGGIFKSATFTWISHQLWGMVHLLVKHTLTGEKKSKDSHLEAIVKKKMWLWFSFVRKKNCHPFWHKLFWTLTVLLLWLWLFSSSTKCYTYKLFLIYYNWTIWVL